MRSRCWRFRREHPAKRLNHLEDGQIADYAHMMQLRKSRWMGTQIIQIGA
jgi:hypothetical protein